MGIVIGFRRTLEVPGDPGQTITIAMLSGLQLEEAARVRLEKAITWAKKINAVDEAVEAARAAKVAEAAPAQREPTAEELEAADHASYDTDLVLQQGVVGWTYTDGTAPLPVDVALFDDATRKWAKTEVLRFSKRTAAELGKASSASTGS